MYSHLYALTVTQTSFNLSSIACQWNLIMFGQANHYNLQAGFTVRSPRELEEIKTAQFVKSTITSSTAPTTTCVHVDLFLPSACKDCNPKKQDVMVCLARRSLSFDLWLAFAFRRREP
jgi:hypothetical protein